MAHSTNKTNQKKVKAAILETVMNFDNDPFFINKDKRSREFLDKHGFPQEALQKMQRSVS